jgi:hypothetical protein
VKVPGKRCDILRDNPGPPRMIERTVSLNEDVEAKERAIDGDENEEYRNPGSASQYVPDRMVS